jgi:hypothetical protein
MDKSYVLVGKTSSSSSPNEHSKFNASGINFGAYLDADVEMESATPVSITLNIFRDQNEETPVRIAQQSKKMFGVAPLQTLFED